MRIYIKAITKASKNEVIKLSEGEYKVKVTVAPEKGKANDMIIKLLADYFKVAKRKVEIVGGKTASRKIVDID